jgi:hypothetical protein
MRSKKTILVALTIGLLAAGVLAQGGRGKAEATIKGANISIDYGRPALGGQASRLGEATDGMIWRLGMNKATHLETSRDIVVGGKELKAGKYTLWARKVSGNNWQLLFHPKTDVWGAPELKEGFIAELPLKYEKGKSAVDQLTITLAETKGKAGVTVQWGVDVLSGAFDVK